jgi:hypothetical protein
LIGFVPVATKPEDVPLEQIEESTRKWVNFSFSYQTLYSKKNNLKVLLKSI